MADESFDGFDEQPAKAECRFPASSGKGFCLQPPSGSGPHCERHTCQEPGCTEGKSSSRSFCPKHDTGHARTSSTRSNASVASDAPPTVPSRKSTQPSGATTSAAESNGGHADAPAIGSRCGTPYGDGAVRYVGNVTAPSGKSPLRIGVELDERKGKNDGTAAGKRYFSCQQGYGVFVRPELVTALVQDAKPAQDGAGKENGNGTFEIGSRCGTPYGDGTVRFAGDVVAPGGESLLRVGIELDKRDGKNDGEAFGKRYFQCAQGHGVFVRAELVTGEKGDDVSNGLPSLPAQGRSVRSNAGTLTGKPVINPLFGLDGGGGDGGAEEFDGFDESNGGGSGGDVAVRQGASEARRDSSVFDPTEESEDENDAPVKAQVVVPVAESIYSERDPDKLVAIKRKALQDKMYDTCPLYAEVRDGKTTLEGGASEVKYEGEPIEDADEPRTKIEGEDVPPDRDVVNCKEGFKRSPNSKTAVFTLGTFCSLVSWLALGTTGPLIATFVFAIFYLVEAFFVSRTFKYLWNQMTRTKTVEHYNKMVNRQPWVRWYIENYHYETHTYTDSDGNTHTTTVRVVTHTASLTHQINEWTDASFPFGDVRHKMTKLKMKKHFMWADSESKAMHDADFWRWERRHTTDAHHFVTWNWGISGWKSAIFEVEDGERAPWWVRYGLPLYFFAALSLMSWPYRQLLASVVTKRKEHIRKICGWYNQM